MLSHQSLVGATSVDAAALFSFGLSCPRPLSFAAGAPRSIRDAAAPCEGSPDSNRRATLRSAKTLPNSVTDPGPAGQTAASVQPEAYHGSADEIREGQSFSVIQ